MKNGQKTKSVKCTQNKTVLSVNITKLRNEKNLSVKELAEKAGISRQAMYNIIKGTSIPHQSTIDLIAKQLDVSSDLLLYGIRHYDYEIFMEKLNSKFPYNMNSKEFDTDYKEYIGEGTSDDVNYDLQGFLVYKFDIDPINMFHRWIAPSSEKQSEIADYFGYEVNDIFKMKGNFPIGCDSVGFQHVNVCVKDEFDNVSFKDIFEKLNLKNKKLVLNLCMDLLQIQDN